MNKRPFFGPLYSFFLEFTPIEWSEERFLKLPFKIIGDSLIEPSSEEVKDKLNHLEEGGGLKKRRDGKYIVSTSNMRSIVRMFRWFVARSWKNKEYGIIWSLLHLTLPHYPNPATIKVEEISKITGYDLSSCEEIIKRFVKVKEGSEYKVDSSTCLNLFDSYRRSIPTSTEERIMGDVLCPEGEAFSKDICNRMVYYGLGESAVYKAIEKLKKDGFIKVKEYKRRGRGPVSELLVPCCETNCFLGFSSKDRCYEFYFYQLINYIKEEKGITLKPEVKDAIYQKLRNFPDSWRIIQKLIQILILESIIEKMKKDEKVLTALEIVKETYTR